LQYCRCNSARDRETERHRLCVFCTCVCACVCICMACALFPSGQRAPMVLWRLSCHPNISSGEDLCTLNSHINTTTSPISSLIWKLEHISHSPSGFLFLLPRSTVCRFVMHVSVLSCSSYVSRCVIRSLRVTSSRKVCYLPDLECVVKLYNTRWPARAFQVSSD
jgi:hypothetical protein